jgi:hypothetical protein
MAVGVVFGGAGDACRQCRPSPGVSQAQGGS